MAGQAFRTSGGLPIRDTAGCQPAPRAQGNAKSALFHPVQRYVEGMKAIQIEYPEAWPAAAGSSAERFENEARLAAAMKLFEMGRLTSGQAAQLAVISRMAFLFSCEQWNVPVVNWDNDELAAEFKPLPL